MPAVALAAHWGRYELERADGSGLALGQWRCLAGCVWVGCPGCRRVRPVARVDESGEVECECGTRFLLVGWWGD